jgi:rhamnosyltransferase
VADSESISSLISAFEDPAVAVAFGHQLPRKGAGAIKAHARRFNYAALSSIRDMNARARLGFKTIFISNSFAAYRRSVLIEVGGFPQDVIFGEDTVTAARILRAGHKIAYIAQAKVYHSHSYTMIQEFKRYFDIGVLHNRESWMLEMFDSVLNEENRYVASEINYLRRHNPSKIPSAILRSLLKYVGYKLGRMEDKLSVRVKYHLSMHRAFWNELSRNS